jgi:hypothetical protein
VPIQLPIGAEGDFARRHRPGRDEGDRLQGRARHRKDEIEIPENLAAAAAAAREHLLEEVSHYDDALLELILEEAEVPEELLKAAIRKATLSTKLTPVLCGSSFKNKGVQPLLDAVIDYLPSPLDVPPVHGTELIKGEEEEREVPPRRRLRAVRGAGVQDRGRPLRRQAHLLPRLLRPPGGGRAVLNVGTGKHRADRAHPDDARQRARGGRRGLRRRHRRGGRASSRSPPATRSPPPTRRSSSRTSSSPSR